MRKSIQSAKKKITNLRSLAAASMLCSLVMGASVHSSYAASETTATATTTTTTTTTTATPGAPTKPGDVLLLRSLTKADRYKQLDQSQLHRLDFRVTGSGCAACLGRIRKRIDKLKGIGEVAVAIKEPYGVAVIYDASKVTKEEILKVGMKDETLKIEFKDVVDAKIDKPPMILVPIYNNMLKK
ncbi:MAG: heavy-metal-associated domain-containing protein [Candidatus Melainabacteria bacterium]|nr:heavy-metal-associated domain-containing protein [Candidatus Melainabacteria bacterium]